MTDNEKKRAQALVRKNRSMANRKAALGADAQDPQTMTFMTSAQTRQLLVDFGGATAGKRDALLVSLLSMQGKVAQLANDWTDFAPEFPDCSTHELRRWAAQLAETLGADPRIAIQRLHDVRWILEGIVETLVAEAVQGVADYLSSADRQDPTE